MTWIRWATEGVIVVNFLSFTLLSSSLFRLDQAGLTSYLFFLSFLCGICTSMWVLVHHPTDQIFLLLPAVCAAAASGSLFAAAARVIRSAPLTAIFSPDQPQFVHTTGPYSRIRHPFYTSYILNFFAAGLACSQWAPSLVFLAALIIYSYAARQEEKKFSQSPIAVEYEAYRRKTSMLFSIKWKRGNQ